jgi:hypothetical protein
MAAFDPRRHPRAGTGKFTEKPDAARAPISLGADSYSGALYSGDDVDDAPELPATEDILAADSEQLWSFVRHGDPLVREEAAGNVNLTAEQSAELADPQRQPSSVREAVARLPYPGVASRAVRDPDPIVRWLGEQGGWDLSPQERSALAADPDVARVRAVMSGRLQPSY